MYNISSWFVLILLQLLSGAIQWCLGEGGRTAPGDTIQSNFFVAEFTKNTGQTINWKVERGWEW